MAGIEKFLEEKLSAPGQAQVKEPLISRKDAPWRSFSRDSKMRPLGES